MRAADEIIHAWLARHAEGEHEQRDYDQDEELPCERMEHDEQQSDEDQHEGPGMDIDNTDIAEVCSPERVATTCKKYGLKAGESMDVKMLWDFMKEEDRSVAWKATRCDEPPLVIRSPPCTAVSTLHNMHEAKWRGNAIKEERRRCIWKVVVRHVEAAGDYDAREPHQEEYYGQETDKTCNTLLGNSR